MQIPETLRLDKWLWCARFYKTRGLAADEVDRGRVQVNGRAAKPGKDLKPGDLIEMRQGPVHRSVRVVVLNPLRGPASVAHTMYEESTESIQAREAAAEQRRMAPDPAASQSQGRPTKRDRREIERAGGAMVVRDARWSASLADD